LLFGLRRAIIPSGSGFAGTVRGCAAAARVRYRLLIFHGFRQIQNALIKIDIAIPALLLELTDFVLLLFYSALKPPHITLKLLNHVKQLCGCLVVSGFALGF